MNTLMNNLNKQLFQELDDRIAANLSGGQACLYKYPDFSGKKICFESGGNVPDNFKNKISTITISNNEKWNFYKEENYKGYLATLGPGKYDADDLSRIGIDSIQFPLSDLLLDI